MWASVHVLMPRVVELAGRRGGQGDTVGSSPDKYLVLLCIVSSQLVPRAPYGTAY